MTMRSSGTSTLGRGGGGSETATQQKCAEKLVILNDRSKGMLTRLYNIKKSCAKSRIIVDQNGAATGNKQQQTQQQQQQQQQRSRFWPLRERSLDSAIAHLLKKFPVVPDVRRNSSTYTHVEQYKVEIRNSLSIYYHTLAELLELKDYILNLLNTINSSQCSLDITVNFDLTTGFLNLMSNFVALMLLLARVDDRRAIVALYNMVHQLLHGQTEPSYPRLGQMLVDYDQPLRQLSDDFASISGLISDSLTSIYPIYFRRNISADQLRDAGMMSLLSAPQQMLFAAQTDTVACEYLSLDTMDRWIVFGMTVCASSLLADPPLEQMFYKALEHSLSLRLFRDEALLTFNTLIAHFETSKSTARRVAALKEHHTEALRTCVAFHAHRREFVRTTLREMTLLIRDQPGLLGPKVLFVWMGLSLARDEVHWLLRHADLVHTNKKMRAALEHQINDQRLPELLHYMAELRSLVQDNARIIANYYRDFIVNYDTIAMREMLDQDPSMLNKMTTIDATLIRTLIDALSRLDSHDVNLCGVRLDWYRFQANVSMARSPFQLKLYRQLAVAFNTAIFHTRMIDQTADMLRETSDLSIYCYYPSQFDAHAEAALQFAPQSRYTIAFAHVAENFANSIHHDMCPEERDHIIERGIFSCNAVLEKCASYASRAFEDFCREEHLLADAAGPAACAEMIFSNWQDQQLAAQGGKAAAAAAAQRRPRAMPGHESERTRERRLDQSTNRSTTTTITAAVATTGDLNELERHALYFVELLQAIAHTPTLNVSDHTFTPKAYLYPRLEFALCKTLVLYAQPTQSATPRRPSAVAEYARAQLAALQRVDDCVGGIDIARLASESLLQQSQPLDASGHFTLMSVYAKFYSDLLHRASLGQCIFSSHLRCFLAPSAIEPLVASSQIDFAPEHYTDARELRALATLITPLGIKSIAERLTSMIAGQLLEIVALVRTRPTHTLLREARRSYDKPARMRELVAALADPTTAASALSGVYASAAASTMSVNSSGSGSTGVGATAAATNKKSSSASSASPSGGGAAGSNSPIECVLQRLTIIGGIAAFRNLLYDATNETLLQRAPFLMSSLLDLYESADENKRMALSETCAATGIATDVDQGLVNLLRIKWNLPPLERPPLTHEIEEHYELCCLVMVLVAVALPQLHTQRSSFYRASFAASQNNSHTIADAVSLIAGALFYIHGRDDVADRMREFLALSSSCLVELVHVDAIAASETSNGAAASIEPSTPHHPTLILLEQIVERSPWLSANLLESCVPFANIRLAYLQSYRSEPQHSLGVNDSTR